MILRFMMRSDKLSIREMFSGQDAGKDSSGKYGDFSLNEPKLNL